MKTGETIHHRDHRGHRGEDREEKEKEREKKEREKKERENGGIFSPLSLPLFLPPSSFSRSFSLCALWSLW
jgi:hypothetical protein